MKIAVLSGKGGTGKTTIAVNLAKTLGYRYADCDVEEPNGFIFLKPEIKESRDVEVPKPEIDVNKCTLCKRCVDICEFNALAMPRNKVIVFEKLCHGCGACLIACPVNAITEKNRVIGKVDIGTADDIQCIRGLLNVGEPMGVPIIGYIRELLDEKPTIIDCAPGSSCNVVKAIKGVDFAVLVTEPTEFGLHDLKIAVSLVNKLDIPFGVVINRCDEFSNLIINYCNENNIRIMGTIPYDRNAAYRYSRGQLLVDEPNFRKVFMEIAQNMKEVVLCKL